MRHLQQCRNLSTQMIMWVIHAYSYVTLCVGNRYLQDPLVGKSQKGDSVPVIWYVNVLGIPAQYESKARAMAISD